MPPQREPIPHIRILASKPRTLIMLVEVEPVMLDLEFHSMIYLDPEEPG
jgi:hypothetical protein